MSSSLLAQLVVDAADDPASDDELALLEEPDHACHDLGVRSLAELELAADLVRDGLDRVPVDDVGRSDLALLEEVEDTSVNRVRQDHSSCGGCARSCQYFDSPGWLP